MNLEQKMEYLINYLEANYNYMSETEIIAITEEINSIDYYLDEIQIMNSL